MVVDSTLQFAARRNVPIRYNRDLVATTLGAMQRVSEIRARRERAFYKNRMAGNKEKERAANRKLVAENQHLLPKVRAEVEVVDRMEVEKNVLELQQVERVRQMQTLTQKGRMKKRLLVGGGVEEVMDVD